MNFFLFIYLTCATALLPLLYFSAKAIKELFLARQQKKNSAEAKARVLGVRVMNEARRRVPFVRLTVEVFARNGESFVADAEGFYSYEELSCLQPGAVIRVRYGPCAKGPLWIVKDPARTKNETKLFVGEGGEIIAAKTDPVQSRAARPRRLAVR